MILASSIRSHKFLKMRPSISQAKKAPVAQSDEEGAGPSSPQQHPPVAASPAVEVTVPNMAEGVAATLSDIAAPPLGSLIGPSTAVLPPSVLQQAVGVPAVIAAAAAPRRSTPLPTATIRPVIVRQVVAAGPAAGGMMTTQPPAASAALTAPIPDMMTSALEAVRRARRMVDESYKKKREAEGDNECIVCFRKLKRAARLQPCGHVQMCPRCCKELLATAESKQSEPLVSVG